MLTEHDTDMIAVDKRALGEGADVAVAQWKDIMSKLRRNCSSPYEAFLKHLSPDATNYSKAKTEPDWGLCKLRNDEIRSKERLGTNRPLTRRSESGFVE